MLLKLLLSVPVISSIVLSCIVSNYYSTREGQDMRNINIKSWPYSRELGQPVTKPTQPVTLALDLYGLNRKGTF
jgi:hypothetical protein